MLSSMDSSHSFEIVSIFNIYSDNASYFSLQLKAFHQTQAVLFHRIYSNSFLSSRQRNKILRFLLEPYLLARTANLKYRFPIHLQPKPNCGRTMAQYPLFDWFCYLPKSQNFLNAGLCSKTYSQLQPSAKNAVC